MPKEILNLTLNRSNKNEKWGFVMIGGKDQALTVKVGKVWWWGRGEGISVTNTSNSSAKKMPEMAMYVYIRTVDAAINKKVCQVNKSLNLSIPDLNMPYFF